MAAFVSSQWQGQGVRLPGLNLAALAEAEAQRLVHAAVRSVSLKAQNEIAMFFAQVDLASAAREAGIEVLDPELTESTRCELRQAILMLLPCRQPS